MNDALLEMYRVDPNPRLVWLLDFAITEAASRCSGGEYREWLAWASSWQRGQRSPAACVDIAHRCFEHKGNPVWHCLGQLAWAAKEACYSTPKSGWLVVNYISDAMLALGVAFPANAIGLVEAPTIDLSVGGKSVDSAG